jgi:hypothetical protein
MESIEMKIAKMAWARRTSTAAMWALIPVLAASAAAARAQVATFYVALNGNDSWSGTRANPNPKGTDGPFATFDHARTVVQALNKAGLTQVVVEFREGTYFLHHTEIFAAADSGAATTPIVYENYPGESAVISGGIQVQGWTNVSGNEWQATLPASTQYFEQLFYNGERRLRPRLGTTARAECDQVVDEATEETGHDHCRDLGEYLRMVGPVYLASQPAAGTTDAANCSVYVAGSGWECFDRFYYQASDPISGTWMNLTPPTPSPSPTCDPSSGSTAPVGDIELLDFEKYTASKLRISCVDSTNNIVYLTGPTSFVTQPTAHGFIPLHRYLVENVQDELKYPGQWFLDRSKSPMVLTYLAKRGEDLNTDGVIIPQLSPVLEAFNLQYVTFRGLTFAHDNYTIPPQGHADTEIPYDIGAVVSIQNSQNITFDADVVTQTSGAGLEFISCTNPELATRCLMGIMNPSGVTANNVVKNSAFYDLGEDGVRVGIQSLSQDSVSNVPQFMTVENNVVEGYGRVFPNAWGISQGDGHNNAYTHNDVYDGYHAAIGICQCTSVMPASGGVYNNTISFNRVYNLQQGIMNDAGSIYIAAGNAVFTAAGNQILNNIVHDVNDASALDGSPADAVCPTGLPCDGYGGHGIYLDTQTGLVDVENNLVYRVSDADLNFPMTPPAPNEENTIQNNIFAFARLAAINDGDPYPTGSVPPSAIQTFVAKSNLFYFDRSYTSSPSFTVQGGCTYSGGFIYPDYQLWESNLYWRTDGAFATDAKAFHVQPLAGADSPCTDNTAKWTFYTFAGWQQQPPTTTPPPNPGEDVGSVVQNPGFANPAYPADDYRLPGGSPGVGFVVFDLSRIGRSNPVILPPPIAGTFVTATFNPAKDF